MKIRFFSLALLLAFASATKAELKLELPQGNLVLQSTDLPLSQRESQLLPTEDAFIKVAAPLLNARKPEQALQTFKTQFKDLSETLEAGDPKGELRQRLVASFNPFVMPKPNAVSVALIHFVAQIYFVQKNYPAAEAALKLTLTAMPDFARGHELLGFVYVLTERNAEALTHLSKAVQLGLNTPNLNGALGFLNQRLENYFGASAAFQTAMMLEPDNPQWQQGLLNSFASSKQHVPGLALTEQLLKKGPSEAELWLFRANLQLDAGQRQQALASLEAAIRLGDTKVSTLQVCAALHLEMGSVDRAVTLLKTGIGKELDFRFVDQSMQTLVVRDQWAALAKLLDEYKTFTGLNEVQQSRVLLRRGNVSLHNNDAAQGKSQLQQAVTLDPANAEALITLAQQLHKEKNYAQAELLLQRASASGEFNTNANLLLAQLAIDQRNYVKAVKLLRDVHTRDPSRIDLARNIEALESLLQLEGGN